MKTKILNYASLLLMIAFMAISCSEDDPSLEIYMPSAKAVVNATFDLADTVTFTATIVGADYPTVSVHTGSDITVNFKVDADKVAIYNAEMGTKYVILPAENYTLDESAIIAKGENTTPPVKLIVKNGETINPFSIFLLPISIDQVNGGSVGNTQQTTYVILTRSPALENLPAFDRSGWTIADMSTEEPGEGAPNGLATAAIDDDWGTFWHSKWAGNEPPPPHYITVDMGEIIDVHGVSIVDRNLGDWAHGQPRKMTVELSSDGVTFTMNGNYAAVPMKTDPVQEEIRFFLTEFGSARYIRLTVTATWGDTNSTNLAELYAF